MSLNIQIPRYVRDQDYEPGALPTNSAISQWFTKYLGPYITAELRAIRRALFPLPFALASDFDLPYNSDTDAVPALERMCKKIPDGNTLVFNVPGYLTVKPDDGWVLTARRGLTLTTMRLPFPDGRDSATIFVSGRSSSGPGGRLLYLRSCSNCEVSGFHFATDLGSSVDVALELDESSVRNVAGDAVVGTRCHVTRNLFNNRGMNPRLVLVRISETIDRNQEHHDCTGNQFNAGPGGAFILRPLPDKQGVLHGGVSVTAGSIDVYAPTDDYMPKNEFPKKGNEPVVIFGAAADGTALHARYLYDSLSHCVLDRPAERTLPNTRMIIGESVGTCVRIGPSANAKHIILEKNQMSNARAAVQCAGGSFHSTIDRFDNNEMNYELLNASQVITIEKGETENSRQHIVSKAPVPLTIKENRFGNMFMKPDDGYLRFLPGCDHVTLESNNYDDECAPTSRLFDATGAALYLLSRNNRFHPSTMDQVGYTTVNGYLVKSEGDGIITDAGSMVFTIVGGTGAGVNAESVTLVHGGDPPNSPESAAHVAKVVSAGGVSRLIAHHSQADKQTGTGGGATVIAHQSSLATESPDTHGVTFVDHDMQSDVPVKP